MPSPKPRAAEAARTARMYFLPGIIASGHNTSGSSLCSESYRFLDGPGPYPNPTVSVTEGDPLTVTDAWIKGGAKAVFICPAHPTTAGGNWQSNTSGLECEVYRRSTLHSQMTQPTTPESHYPISSNDNVLAPQVTVFASSAADQYEPLPEYYDIPIVALPIGLNKPRSVDGDKYSLKPETESARDKIIHALATCAIAGYDTLVIGDVFLGKLHQHPPRELARLFHDIICGEAKEGHRPDVREVCPNLRGHFRHIHFCFPDGKQNTRRMIRERSKQSHDRRDATDLQIFLEQFRAMSFAADSDYAAASVAANHPMSINSIIS